MRIKLAHPLTLQEIANATGGYVPSTYANRIIHYIATDSREVFKGDLFIALMGEKFDGKSFVPIIIIKEAFHFSSYNDPRGVRVDDTAKCLLLLAEYYKTKFSSLRYTIGITGSVGKTTTKEFLKVILSQKYSVHATYKNNNNTLGVPLTVLAMPRNTQILIVEMGMNHSGEISKSSLCIRPDVSIILNVGTSHIGNLGSREKIAEAKLEITHGMDNGLLLVPFNEPLLKIEGALTFDTENENADFHFKHGNRTEFRHRKKTIADFEFKLNGKHLTECLIASVSAAHLVGLSPNNLSNGISLISEDNTRQRVISVEDFYVLEDYYNASPESVIAAMESLSAFPSYQRKSVLLGDILELGERSEQIHKELGYAISKYSIYNLYLLGDFSKNIMEGAIEYGFPRKRIFINPSLDSPGLTAEAIRKNHTRGEIILMKASRGVKLERVLAEFVIKDGQI